MTDSIERLVHLRAEKHKLDTLETELAETLSILAKTLHNISTSVESTVPPSPMGKSTRPAPHERVHRAEEIVSSMTVTKTEVEEVKKLKLSLGTEINQLEATYDAGSSDLPLTAWSPSVIAAAATSLVPPILGFEYLSPRRSVAHGAGIVSPPEDRSGGSRNAISPITPSPREIMDNAGAGISTVVAPLTNLSLMTAVNITDDKQPAHHSPRTGVSIASSLTSPRLSVDGDGLSARSAEQTAADTEMRTPRSEAPSLLTAINSNEFIKVDSMDVIPVVPRHMSLGLSVTSTDASSPGRLDRLPRKSIVDFGSDGSQSSLPDRPRSITSCSSSSIGTVSEQSNLSPRSGISMPSVTSSIDAVAGLGLDAFGGSTDDLVSHSLSRRVSREDFHIPSEVMLRLKQAAPVNQAVTKVDSIPQLHLPPASPPKTVIKIHPYPHSQLPALSPRTSLPGLSPRTSISSISSRPSSPHLASPRSSQDILSPIAPFSAAELPWKEDTSLAGLPPAGLAPMEMLPPRSPAYHHYRTLPHEFEASLPPPLILDSPLARRRKLLESERAASSQSEPISFLRKSKVNVLSVPQDPAPQFAFLSVALSPVTVSVSANLSNLTADSTDSPLGDSGSNLIQQEMISPLPGLTVPVKSAHQTPPTRSPIPLSEPVAPEPPVVDLQRGLSVTTTIETIDTVLDQSLTSVASSEPTNDMSHSVLSVDTVISSRPSAQLIPVQPTPPHPSGSLAAESVILSVEPTPPSPRLTQQQQGEQLQQQEQAQSLPVTPAAVVVPPLNLPTSSGHEIAIQTETPSKQRPISRPRPTSASKVATVKTGGTNLLAKKQPLGKIAESVVVRESRRFPSPSKTPKTPKRNSTQTHLSEMTKALLASPVNVPAVDKPAGGTMPLMRLTKRSDATSVATASVIHAKGQTFIRNSHVSPFKFGTALYSSRVPSVDAPETDSLAQTTTSLSSTTRSSVSTRPSMSGATYMSMVEHGRQRPQVSAAVKYGDTVVAVARSGIQAVEPRQLPSRASGSNRVSTRRRSPTRAIRVHSIPYDEDAHSDGGVSFDLSEATDIADSHLDFGLDDVMPALPETIHSPNEHLIAHEHLTLTALAEAPLHSPGTDLDLRRHFSGKTEETTPSRFPYSQPDPVTPPREMPEYFPVPQSYHSTKSDYESPPRNGVNDLAVDAVLAELAQLDELEHPASHSHHSTTSASHLSVPRQQSERPSLSVSIPPPSPSPQSSSKRLADPLGKPPKSPYSKPRSPDEYPPSVLELALQTLFDDLRVATDPRAVCEALEFAKTLTAKPLIADMFIALGGVKVCCNLVVNFYDYEQVASGVADVFNVVREHRLDLMELVSRAQAGQ